MNNKYKELFETFLKENKVYQRYTAYSLKHYNGDASGFIKHAHPKKYLQGAFMFEHTDEGFDFWNDLHKKWVEFLENCTPHKFRIVIHIDNVKTDIFETKQIFDDLLKSKNSSYNITIEEL